ncbi:hypothetical protein LTR08_000585 [Meristemomyces frigidus]|nr:hypothetical protein LTR08_000585 [Meristemomyces frigidus]
MTSKQSGLATDCHYDHDRHKYHHSYHYKFKMRSFTFATAGLLAYATSAFATDYIIKDYCQENVFLYFANATATTGPFELASGQAYIHNITGEGISVGMVKNPNDYWSSTGSKLILGATANKTQAMLYWTINSVDGDAMKGETFSVTSAGRVDDVCGHATTYDGQVHACADDGNVTLTLNLC